MKDIHDAAMEFARLYEKKHGKPPIILGMEIYEHFGQPCEITRASEYEVAVMARFADVATIEPDELQLRRI